MMRNGLAVWKLKQQQTGRTKMARTQIQKSQKDKAREEGHLQKQPARSTAVPRKEIFNLQQKAGNRAVSQHLASELPDREKEAENLAGRPLDPDTRVKMEERFGHEFSQVRIHTDGQAAESAQSLEASAFTSGEDISFDKGEYAPSTEVGKKLLAHELAHVLQQRHAAPGKIQDTLDTGQSAAALEHAADQSAEAVTSGKKAPVVAPPSTTPAVQRKKSPKKRRAGSKQEKDKQSKPKDESNPPGTNYRQVTMHFDGQDLIVYGDGSEIYRYSADSGRPVEISEEHAKDCGADVTTDTYMNDRRFVGISNFGPIPEGTYSFSPPKIQRYSSAEQRKLILEGILGEDTTTIRGQRTHTGDWGGGRVALKPKGRVREGPCGNANKRSAFYLHGGILAGSSGCIDIGGGFDQLADFLADHKRNIKLTVRYENDPPTVRFFTGLGGAIAYNRFRFRHGPRLRIGTEFSPSGTRFLASTSYDAILQWAGGALSAGVRLDVPMNDKEKFIRAGLSTGANFRLLGALYGRLFAGYSVTSGDEQEGEGWELGGGIQYDFGRVQLEAVYNAIRPFTEDEKVQQALIGIGFSF